MIGEEYIMQNLDWMTKDMSGALLSPSPLADTVENNSNREYSAITEHCMGLPEAQQINYATSTSEFISKDSYFFSS
jgi:hypothetical protein